jgi:uncharacterized FlaG/YvyC family protein
MAAESDITVRALRQVEPAQPGEQSERRQQQPGSNTPQPPLPASPSNQELAGDAASTSGRLKPAIAQMMVDERTHLVYVRIIDPVTNELIREIPSDEVERVSDVMRDYSGAARRQIAAQQQKATAA